MRPPPPPQPPPCGNATPCNSLEKPVSDNKIFQRQLSTAPTTLITTVASSPGLPTTVPTTVGTPSLTPAVPSSTSSFTMASSPSADTPTTPSESPTVTTPSSIASQPIPTSTSESITSESSTPVSSPSSTSATPESTPSSTSTPETTSSSSTPTPTSESSTSSTTSSSETSTTTSSTSSSSSESSSIVTVTSDNGSTSVVTVTSFSTDTSTSSTTTSTSATPTPIDASGDDSGSGLSEGATVAIGVVVPIVGIAILAAIGFFWWKKRKARKLAEEERRKEVEDYSYNPNADPTIPGVAYGGSENAYEMNRDASSGYRGWGSTTVAGSTGRKASTTMSGGVAGAAYSDATSPTHGNASLAQSGEPLMEEVHTPEGEILGAMGPSAANNRGADVHRGPSNASSSYSATGRSEGSEGPGGMSSYGNGGTYYDQASQGPYSDRPQELSGQPVIRDNPARRNTRIENPSHYPQQSAGISQNF